MIHREPNVLRLSQPRSDRKAKPVVSVRPKKVFDTVPIQYHDIRIR